MKDVRSRLWFAGGVLAAAVLLTFWAASLPGMVSVSLRPLPGVIAALLWVVIFTIPVWFAAWTWRRMWRGKREGREPIVYNTGVFRFGLAMGVAGTIFGTFRDLWPPRVASAADLSALLFRFVVIALVQLPVSLWIGYVWGRLMGTMRRRS